MRLVSVRIQHFRGLRDVTVTFDTVTRFIGMNGSCKSTVFHALQWFFEGGPVEPSDVTDCTTLDDLLPGTQITVSVKFTDLSALDRDALGSYGREDTVTLTRRWSWEEGEKLTGRGWAFPPFEVIRALRTAQEKVLAYAELRKQQPALDLPSASTAKAVLASVDGWERDPQNANLLEHAEASATHLFGAVGTPKLAGRFDYVLVPASSDLEAEAASNAKGTLLAQILARSGATNAARVLIKSTPGRSEGRRRVPYPTAAALPGQQHLDPGEHRGSDARILVHEGDRSCHSRGRCEASTALPQQPFEILCSRDHQRFHIDSPEAAQPEPS